MKIRPKYICMGFTLGNTAAAMLLEELFYWAKYAGIKKGDNPVIVHSYEDWMELTGLSFDQVRRALTRLKELGIIETYAAFSKYKHGQKCLHIAVVKEFYDAFNALRENDFVKTEMYDVAQSEMYDTVHFYIKEKKSGCNPEGEPKFAKGTPPDLTEEEVEEYEREVENLYKKPVELWKMVCEREYPEIMGVDLDHKQKKFLLDFAEEQEDIVGSCYTFIRKSIEQWDEFCNVVKLRGSVTPFIPKKPSVSFFYAHRTYLADFLDHIVKAGGCGKEEVFKYINVQGGHYG